MNDDDALKTKVLLSGRSGLRKTTGIPEFEINIPTKIQKNKNYKLRSIFSFTLSVSIIFLIIVLYICIISGSSHNLFQLITESIFFLMMIIFSMRFLEMTFSNFWVDVFEGGTTIIIDKEGILDPRISIQKIKFEYIISANISSRPIAGTGGVFISIPKNKIKLRLFRFHLFIYNYLDDLYNSIPIETKGFSVDSCILAGVVMRLNENK